MTRSSSIAAGFAALLALLLPWIVTPAIAADLGGLEAVEAEIAGLASAFPAFASMPWGERDEAAFLYGDTRGIVHLLVSDGERLREKWKSFPLEGSVREVFGADLDQDGHMEIVAWTSGARIYVWETTKYELMWESVDEKFEAIQAMAIANVDRDNALEMVVCADNKVAYYDGIEFFREREGRDFVEPGYMVIADVDGDLTDEIVLNDGYVLDTATLNIEWATDGFGYPMTLFDV
ncbi:MAG: hypothetical protein QGI43_05405, partial [Gemmatimonadota bacterium]|nr:hypothetical protein [Gemmatimonadota bacterium]